MDKQAILDKIKALAERQQKERDDLMAELEPLTEKTNNVHAGDIWLYHRDFCKVISVSKEDTGWFARIEYLMTGEREKRHIATLTQFGSLLSRNKPSEAENA